MAAGLGFGAASVVVRLGVVIVFCRVCVVSAGLAVAGLVAVPVGLLLLFPFGVPVFGLVPVVVAGAGFEVFAAAGFVLAEVAVAVF